MKKLPIGIQTFSSIIEGDFVYIDKTPQIVQMLQGAGRYFLSRPRRFGKSLLLDTLNQVFEGKKALFEGLYLEDQWDWSQKYPVLRFDFADGMFASRAELDEEIRSQLRLQQNKHQVECEEGSVSAVFRSLIQAVEKKYQQQVVILIDEYDKPILDNIEQTEQAAELRDGLKSFYSVMKGQDAHIRFIFMTGVTKFSKVSLFSGINQIKDITLDQRYSTLCGYTEQDLRTEFSGHLVGVDWHKLKTWYNGYSFCGEAVYNPYDILLFLDSDHSYRNYWFETGSPSFLLKLFKQQAYFLPDLENIEVGEEILDSFDIERINPVTLLFQAGYLTIKHSYTDELDEQAFVLEVPNREVKTALNTQFIQSYSEQVEANKGIRQRLFKALTQGGLESLQQEIASLFAGIPWRNFTHNDLPDTEGYYASVLYAFFASLNATIIPEDISHHGQADLTIQLGGYIYVMELKRDTSDSYQAVTPNPALQQIQQKGYAQKYLATGKQVFEVGMVFNTQARNLVQMDWAAVTQ